MRILAVNQFYAPDHSATAQILSDLCEDLVGLGEQVSVVASRGTYLGGDRLPARETIRGVEVVRPWATSLGKANIARRLTDYATFFTTAIAAIAMERRPDVILALTTPPMIAAAAAAVARARGIPLVTWVQDIYPEIAIEFGVLGRNSLATRGFRELVRITHGMSTRIVALSDGMVDRLRAQGAPLDRIRVVHNWADGLGVVGNVPDRSSAFRREHGLTGKFVVMYSGNLGIPHEVATVVDAARKLARTEPDVVFLFVGGGARRQEAEKLSAGLTNVKFLGYQPRERLTESLGSADVHLVTLRDGLAGLLVPSKMYGVMACARPLFYVGPLECEVARAVRAYDLGRAVAPGDVSGLASAIARASHDPDFCARAGARGREIFERMFDRPHAVARWREVLSEAASART
jgi:colanic acid biosynthesis glycosyl transferase WcaI